MRTINLITGELAPRLQLTTFNTCNKGSDISAERIRNVAMRFNTIRNDLRKVWTYFLFAVHQRGPDLYFFFTVWFIAARCSSVQQMTKAISGNIKPKSFPQRLISTPLICVAQVPCVADLVVIQMAPRASRLLTGNNNSSFSAKSNFRSTFEAEKLLAG